MVGAAELAREEVVGPLGDAQYVRFEEAVEDVHVVFVGGCVLDSGLDLGEGRGGGCKEQELRGEGPAGGLAPVDVGHGDFCGWEEKK